MSEFAPLGYALGLLLFVGLFLPFVLGFFYEPGDITLNPVASTLTTIINGNFSISVIPFVDFDDFNANPFSWLGDTLRGTISNSITYLSLLPTFLLLFIIIMCSVGILYGIIKLLPTT